MLFIPLGRKIEWYFYTRFYPLTDTAERRKCEGKSKNGFLRSGTRFKDTEEGQYL